MDTQAFVFNSDAKYQTGGVFSPHLKDTQLTQPNIQVGTAGAFQTQFPNVFQKYRLPNISSDQLVQAWNSHPMQFWQNQMNFAVWCATTGCGISVNDHLGTTDPLMHSLYNFHVYYQVRWILDEIQAPLPQDQVWAAFNNPYDRRAYEQICSEFGVSPHTNWRVKGPNHGLGRVYNYWPKKGYHSVGERRQYERRQYEWQQYERRQYERRQYEQRQYEPGDYDPASMSFTKQTTNKILHIEFIKQDALNAESAWSTFVLNKSQGFTRPGVERLNDSIRTYVWVILGAQSQTRTRILGSGTAFDAQKQVLSNLEDAISSPVDLPSAIRRYQDVLQYASSKVDFVFGIGLYMAPSNMLLRIGQVVGYNNEIVVATTDQKLGVNTNINAEDAPASAYTGETGLVMLGPSDTKDQTAAPPTVPLTAATASSSRQHEIELKLLPHMHLQSVSSRQRGTAARRP